jgi:TolA-binding protein
MKPISFCVLMALAIAATGAGPAHGQTSQPQAPGQVTVPPMPQQEQTLEGQQAAQPAIQQTQPGQAAPQMDDMQRMQSVESQLKEQFPAGEMKYWLGQAAQIQGQNTLAIKYYDAYLKDNADGPRSAEATYNLALVQRRTGEYQKAIDQLNALVRNYPASPLVDDALLKIGEIYQDDLHKYAEAVAAYQRVLKLRTDGQYRGMRRLGNIEVQQRNPKAATQYYNQSIEEAGQRQQAGGVELNFTLADAEQRAKFINDNSDHDFEPLNLYFDARTLFTRGDYEGCRKKLAELLKEFRDAQVADDAQMLTADACRRQGELADANAAYERLVQHFPRSPHAAVAWFRIGEFYRMTDRLTAARIAYRNALDAAGEQQADSPVAKLAAGRIEEIDQQTRALPRASY